MARKLMSKPPTFADLMQDSFARATKRAAARAELAGAPLAGTQADPEKKAAAPRKTATSNVRPLGAARARKKG